MKHVRRFTAFVIIAAVFLLFPIMASAYTEVMIDGLMYRTTGETTACANNEAEYRANYVIPETVTIGDKEYTVNEIGYIECKNVKSVVVPETVTKIEDYGLGYYFDPYPNEEKDCVIYGYRGTATEEYCNKHRLKFAAILRDGEQPVWTTVVNGDDETRIGSDDTATISAKAFLNEYDYNGFEHPDIESRWYYEKEDGEYEQLDIEDPYDSETATSTLTVSTPGIYVCAMNEKGNTEEGSYVEFYVDERVYMPVSITYNAVNEYTMYLEDLQYMQSNGQYWTNEPRSPKAGDTIDVVFENGSEETYTYDADKYAFRDKDGALSDFKLDWEHWKNWPDDYSVFESGRTYPTYLTIKFTHDEISEIYEVDAYDVKVLDKPYAVVDGIKYVKYSPDDDAATAYAAVADLGEKAEIPEYVTLNDGKEYPVIWVRNSGFTNKEYVGNLKEITIQGKDTKLSINAVGFVYNPDINKNEKVEGFTIYGKRGSDAERYASSVGFTFVALDPEVIDISDTAEVTVSADGLKYTGKALEPAVTVVCGEATLAKDTDYTLEYNNNTNAGTGNVTVTGIGAYNGTVEKTFTIAKAANPLAVKAKTYSVKYATLKKKAQTVAISKLVSFTKKGEGKMSYTLSAAKKGTKSFKKYFAINKTTGKVTIKKGLAKGTYKVTVKLKAAGNTNYKASAEKKVTFTVKVK